MFKCINRNPTKRAPDAGESAAISSSFLRLTIFLAGRLRRPRPSAGNANRWAAPCKIKAMTKLELNNLDQPNKTRRNIDISVYILGIAILIAVIYIQLFPPFSIIRFLAIDGVSFEAGQSNAQQLISAIEKYKIEKKQYPTNAYELLYFHYLDAPIPRPSPSYKYEYEAFPSEDNRQEYMLSFRVKWSIGGYYCYYSEDRQWLKSYSTCWTSPRPQKTSSE